MRLNLRRRGRHLWGDDTGQMTLAIVMIMLVTALVGVTTVTVLAGHTKTRAARAYAVAQQAADAAVNDALLTANTQTLTTPTGGLNPTYACANGGGKTSPAPVMGVEWSWCATPSTVRHAGEAYDIQVTTATGGRTIRSFVATLTGTAVATGADWHEGRVRYAASWQSGFTSGFFADKEVILRGRSAVTSYDSRTGATHTSNARVGTNGTISIDPATRSATTARVADEFVFWDTDTAPARDRCISPPADGSEHLPTACQVARITSHAPRYQVTDDGSLTPNQFITEACKTVQPTWVASAGQPLTNGACYAGLVFDQDTTVDPDTRRTSVYVTGPIVVEPAVVVNTSRAVDPTPDAATLVIYSTGRSVTIEGAGGAIPTRVAWALWAPYADCGGTVGPVDIYGTMLCSRITTQGGWTLHFDDKIKSSEGPADPSAQRIWAVTSYREVTPRR